MGEERGLGMTAVCSDAVSSCDLQERHMIRSTAQMHSVPTHALTVHVCTQRVVSCHAIGDTLHTYNIAEGASLPGEGGRCHLRHWHELHL